jgi:hypothetical protein
MLQPQANHRRRIDRPQSEKPTVVVVVTGANDSDEALDHASAKDNRIVPTVILGNHPADMFHELVTWEDAEWQ